MAKRRRGNLTPLFLNQVQTSDQLLQTLLTNRIIDIGSLLVAVTVVITTTRNTVKALKENVDKLTLLLEQQCKKVNHHDTEIEKIKTRCELLHDLGAGCIGQSKEFPS